MTSTIVFVTDFPDAATAAQEITPSGFELAVVAARSQEYKDALKDLSYLVGFVDSLVDDELFETGPNLKLIQLLSAGYDRADIEAARKSGRAHRQQRRREFRRRLGARGALDARRLAPTRPSAHFCCRWELARQRNTARSRVAEQDAWDRRAWHHWEENRAPRRCIRHEYYLLRYCAPG